MDRHGSDSSMKILTQRLLAVLSSLKLTVVCLSAALVLVFVGTLAQVDGGLHEVQRRYFQSMLIRWPDGPGGWHLGLQAE